MKAAKDMLLTRFLSRIAMRRIANLPVISKRSPIREKAKNLR